MRLFPKQILDEEFIYSSTLSEVDLTNKIKETLEISSGFNFDLNLTGKFVSEDTFCITPKWQLGANSTLLFHSDTNLRGKIQKKNQYETLIVLCVTPHSLFPTSFLLSPIVFITFLFTSIKANLGIVFYILTVSLLILTPIVILFLSNLSKKRLRKRFATHFNLSLVRQVY